MTKFFRLAFMAGGLPFLFAMVANCSYAGEGAMRVFTKSDDKQSVEISLGQDFAIGLPVQMGTGYMWKVIELPEGVVQTGEDVSDGDDNPALGRVEQKLFTFKAAGAGRGHISVTYTRPWETSVPPAETFDLDINVNP